MNALEYNNLMLFGKEISLRSESTRDLKSAEAEKTKALANYLNSAAAKAGIPAKGNTALYTVAGVAIVGVLALGFYALAKTKKA